MCKHILNAQVAVRAPCCQRFFDCPQCHADVSDHPLRKTIEMAFICKKCRRAFRKDLSVFEESDEYCPHCDNCYVIQAKTSDPTLDEIEASASSSAVGDARIDSTMHQALDPRQKYDPRTDFYTQDARALAGGERVDTGGLMGAVERRDEDAARQLEARRVLEAMGGGADEESGPGVDFSKIDDDLDWN